MRINSWGVNVFEWGIYLPFYSPPVDYPYLPLIPTYLNWRAYIHASVMGYKHTKYILEHSRLANNSSALKSVGLTASFANNLCLYI